MEKTNLKLKKPIKNLLDRTMVSVVVILAFLIINKFSPSSIRNIKKQLFEKSFNFVKVNTLTKTVFGKDFFNYKSNDNTVAVLNDTGNLHDIHKYFNGEKYTVSDGLPMGIFESGVVIYIGEKENFKNTVIVQGTDGFNIWYGNLSNINVKLYDYVEKSTLVGTADGTEVYILIEKDGNFYTYEEYKNKN